MATTRRVVVADDDRDGADTTAELLRIYGYEVEVGYDGLEAVQAVRASKAELVILDVNMPRMDGYEAAALLRKEQQPGEVLVLVAHTGRSGPDDVERSRQAGFDHHLSKPADAAKLHDLLGAFLKAKGSHD